MKYTYSEILRRLKDIPRKGWTEHQLTDLIDSLWRDPFFNRTSGFDLAGGTDTTISFDNVTRTFKIEPSEIRFKFWQVLVNISFYKRKEYLDVILPDEDGLYMLFISRDETAQDYRTQSLQYIKNPTSEDFKTTYKQRVVVSFVYWNSALQKAIYIADDRHGSEFNPDINIWAHIAFNAIHDTGLNLNSLNHGTGALDSDAQFGISSGSFLHEDMTHSFNSIAQTTGLNVLWFHGVTNIPTVETNIGFSFLKGVNLPYYNNLTTGTKVEIPNGEKVLYHIFATTCILNPIVAVMGTTTYQHFEDAINAVRDELELIKSILPYHTFLPIGTVILKGDTAFTNTVNTKIEFPTSYFPYFNWLSPNIESILADVTPHNKHVFQSGHGFTIGQAIRANGANYILAKADSTNNSQVCGVVADVFDLNRFVFRSDGFIRSDLFVSGAEYFLSVATGGLLVILPDVETWNVGEVRQFVGFGTTEGLKVEIDVGDEIQTDFGIAIKGDTGAQGAQGLPGTAAEIGYQGAQGDTGAQGVQGTQGNTGTQGAIGTQGTQGFQGTVGAQGVQGTQGFQGNTGAQGFVGIGVQGDIGAQGAQGETGNQGAIGIGAQGVQGETGAQGNQGNTGNQGETGETGVQGTQGNTGTQGAIGNQGTQGEKGTQGNTGAQGSNGGTGAQGDRGSQGYQGTQGNTGGTGVQGATGAQGGVGSQGENGDQGNQGVIGAQGTQGNQGEIGGIGNQGYQGEKGNQGLKGNQGDTGGTGAQGDRGTQGYQGDEGDKGYQGHDGSRGLRGYQGYQGYQGNQGNTGTGTQGFQGVQGFQGTQGNQGNQGFVGEDGTRWYSTVNLTPSPSTGELNDYCVSVTSWDVWIKTGQTTWYYIGNMKGGDGSKWHSGTSNPAIGLGVTGDFYFRTDNGDVFEKMPSPTYWQYTTNINGSKGAQGNQGFQGAPGSGGDACFWERNTNRIFPETITDMVLVGTESSFSSTYIFQVLGKAYVSNDIVAGNKVYGTNGVHSSGNVSADDEILTKKGLNIVGISSDFDVPTVSGKPSMTMWVSDGTDSGSEGDIMISILLSNGVTRKTITLVDFSAS